jgi:hypothetical protein
MALWRRRGDSGDVIAAKAFGFRCYHNWFFIAESHGILHCVQDDKIEVVILSETKNPIHSSDY